MKSLYTWKLVSNSLSEEIPVMLLYVLESWGSSPGRQGFSMAVNAGGDMEGSLGGGVMEHKFVELAKARLLQHTENFSIHKQIHNAAAGKNRSGMICSGEQTILLYRIKKLDEIDISNIISCLEKFRNGHLQITPNGILFSEIKSDEHDAGFTYRGEQDWKYVEQIGYKNHLHIIGGGHCGLALSQLMKGMDFYIHLYDDRPGLKTMMQNQYVHQKKLLEDYTSLAEEIVCGESQYVVIMTFGYRTDAVALEALVDKKLKYLGLLGSSAKIEKMFDDLRRQGIAEEAISRIHAPVGLPINSHTAAEVAVSIAAQIIKVKNG